MKTLVHSIVETLKPDYPCQIMAGYPPHCCKNCNRPGHNIFNDFLYLLQLNYHQTVHAWDSGLRQEVEVMFLYQLVNLMEDMTQCSAINQFAFVWTTTEKKSLELELLVDIIWTALEVLQTSQVCNMIVPKRKSVVSLYISLNDITWLSFIVFFF